MGSQITLEKIKARCETDSGCWVWQGAAGNGYPSIRFGDKVVNARRVVVELKGKTFSASNVIRCRCDDKLCLNPDHLYISSRKSVVKDLVKNGKLGTLASRVKLAAHRRANHAKIESIEVAREIRCSNLSTREEAAKRGVSQKTIWSIRNNTMWIDYSSPFAGLGAR